MENKSIYQKLLKVQGEITPIKKTETNPFFKSKYFDVNAILSELKPLLTKNGLVLSQPLSHEGQYLLLETRLTDAETGETISEKTILPDVGDAQKQGSAITYFRRYALQSFFALEAEDDDGNSAKPPVKSVSKPKAEPKHKDVGRDSAEHDAGNEIDIQL